ncbi:MAG TPA: hypothetical protein VFW67_07605 [Burkholderiaceae bacterium]|jgi:uncharacterized membrane protein|nr:hypothetical protein [Burkholderiaceae bacterium]
MDDQTERLRSLNTVGTISYVLHLIVAVSAVVPGGQWGPTLLIVALVVDLVKRGEAEGTWHATHFSWRLRSVLWAGVLYLVTLPLWLLFFLPGWIAWAVISVWFLYRIIKGMVRMNAGQPMETPA